MNRKHQKLILYYIRTTEKYDNDTRNNYEVTRLYDETHCLDLRDIQDYEFYDYRKMPSVVENFFEHYKDVPLLNGDKHAMSLYFIVEKDVFDRDCEPIDYTEYRIEVGKNGKFKLRKM